jgi:hypothetical protein
VALIVSIPNVTLNLSLKRNSLFEMMSKVVSVRSSVRLSGRLSIYPFSLLIDAEQGLRDITGYAQFKSLLKSLK